LHRDFLVKEGMVMRVNRIHFIALVLIIALISFQPLGCGPVGSGTVPGDSGSDGTQTAAPGYISMALSQTTVKSDNSDSALVTATVLDENRAVIQNLTVSFSVDAGQLTKSSVLTDSEGQAQTTFSSGTMEPSNQIATITAAVSGLNPVQIPVQIIGSMLNASTDKTSITDDGTEIATLTISALSAGGVGLNDIPVELSVSGTGSASLSTESGNTDVNGNLTVTVTGSGAGNVTVRAEGLGSVIAQDYTISPVSTTLRIVSPSIDPYSLPTNTNLTITVNAPAQNNVRFATTLGILTGSSGSGQVVEEQVSGGTASVAMSSSLAGLAMIQVFDADRVESPASDTLMVAVSAPSSEATQVALQVSPSVVAPSLGGIFHTAKLTIAVKNGSDQVVRAAAVQLSIEDPTGGGETVSPVIVYTNDQGIATATFTSGSLSSDAEGVTLKASVLVGTQPVDTKSIIIAGTAASVVVGQGTVIRSVYDDTVYELPMSVLVTDSSGGPVSGVNVSLKTWPVEYAAGYWVEIEENKCEPIGGPASCGYSRCEAEPNEDVNRNFIIDGTETDANGDGQPTPASSYAGTLPEEVTTDSSGVAQFSLIYQKSSAAWIKVEIAATTAVAQSKSYFWLGYLVNDACFLPDSPFDAPPPLVP